MAMEVNQQDRKKLTIHYSLIQCFNVMGYCCVFSFATVFLLSRGFTNSQVGITFTFANGFVLLMNPVVAAFADKTKRMSLRGIDAVMLVGEIILTVLLLVLPVSLTPTACIFILMTGFFATQVSLVTSMAMEHINNGVSINFSLARGIGSFGYAALCLVMGFLVDDYGPRVIMLINVIICLIALVLVLTFRKAKKPVATGMADEPQVSGLIEFMVNNKRFMGVVASAAILFISHIFINTFMIQIIQNAGGSNSDMGIAVGISGFLELPAMALFPLIFKRIRKAGLLMKLAGVFLVIKTFVTLLAPNVFWIDIAQCFQFFAYAMFIPASVYYVNQVIREGDKVKGQAIMTMFMGVSGIIGNFAGGLMLDAQGGVPLMLIVGVIVSIIGLVMLVIIDNFKVAPDGRSMQIE